MNPATIIQIASAVLAVALILVLVVHHRGKKK
jgi:hypothetical protein